MSNWEEAGAFEDVIVAEAIDEIEAQDADNIRATLTEHFS